MKAFLLLIVKVKGNYMKMIFVYLLHMVFSAKAKYFIPYAFFGKITIER